MSMIEARGAIPAPAAAVWDYLGDFGGVERWNPFVQRADVQGQGIGMVREITAQNGATVHETLRMTDPEKHVLQYDVAPPAGEPSTVTIQLVEQPNGQTTVVWQSVRDGEVTDDMRQTVSATLRARIDALATVLAEHGLLVPTPTEGCPVSTDSAGAELQTFPQLRDEPMRPPTAYEAWRESSGVVKTQLHSDQCAWVVLRHDAAREALLHPDISVDAQHPHFPKVRKGVTSRANDTMLRHMDPPMHGRYRRLMTGQFTAKRVAELRPELERIVTEAIDGILAKGGPVDLHRDVSLVIPTKVICALLGVDYKYSADIQRLSSVTTSASATTEELMAAAAEMYEILDSVITEQETEPREGLIGRLITEHMSKGEIEHRQILGQVFMIIVAGHETTANTISMGMLQLFARPDVRKRVTANPDLIPGMVEDMIRMHSLVDGTLSRVAKADMVIGGQKIKNGEGVIVTISAPNYDPRFWDSPYELNIDRNSRDHLSFGAGAHSCMGQNLAREELNLAFQQLLTRIPTLRLADGDAVDMQNDGFIYGARRVMVDW